MIPPLDELTFNRVQRTLDRARKRGASAPEALYQEGLLWTPARERAVRSDAMHFLVGEMEVWRPAEFLRKVNKNLTGATPEDMYRAILQWSRDHVAYAERENP